MKFYLKLFLISFVFFIVIIAGIFYAIEKSSSPYTSKPTDSNAIDATGKNSKTGAGSTSDENPLDDERTELQKIAEESNRINIIAFGLNESLADTMMLISYDPDTQQIDVLSIPRDTYHHIEGYDELAQKKMNAVYGFKEIGGSLGMKNYISKFLGVPIHYYLKVDFAAVEAVVDVLGGYEVKIPFKMDYDDVYDHPPLHIHFNPGLQTLDGVDTVKFLRFRKNNDGSIAEGDVQRIPRQQDFVKSMMKKALSAQLPAVINTVIKGNYVNTDMTIDEILGLAVKASKLETENITFYMVIGEAINIKGSSYWIHDPNELEKTMLRIYDLEVPEIPTTEETNSN